MTRLYIVAHSHLDLAWLWRTEEARRAFIELVENMTRLAEKYSYFTFAQSTALYYEWLAEDRPDLFEKVRKLVDEGRWEVVGGSYVENDCVLPLGESIVRQFLYGLRTLERLGLPKPRVAWYPDSFGFPSSLPKILAGFGIRYLLIQKLNWNDTILFPYNVFRWRSLDGSEVLVYQTAGGYWGDPRAVDIVKQFVYAVYLRHGFKDFLLLYGIGDHGGGPTPEMVEAIPRLCSELAKLGIDHCAHSTSTEFFEYVERTLIDRVPTYVGELYLQFHRGVYTTAMKLKTLIRECERRLLRIEKLLSLAILANAVSSIDEVRSRLSEGWREVLKAHFHDVVSGSIGEEPYKEFRERMEGLLETLKDVESRLLDLITIDDKESVAVFNPLNVRRRVLLKLGDEILELEAEPLSLKNVRVSELCRPPPVRIHRSDDVIELSNDLVSLRIDARRGVIERVSHCEVGTVAERIRLELYEDSPVLGRVPIGIFEKFPDVLFDAWELYAFQRIDGVKIHSLELVGHRLLAEGSRASVELIYRVPACRDTEIVMRVSVDGSSPLIRVDIDADWRCERKVLKLVIETPFYAEWIAVGEPYGYTKRRNPASPYSTLFDRAKWEAPFHLWLDYSDGERGIAVISYQVSGYDAVGSTLRVTLLRAPRFPPPDFPRIESLEKPPIIEQERHRITLYLYPHRGDWEEAKLPLIAEQILEEPIVIPGKRFVKEITIPCSEGSPMITALKPCEDRDSCIVMRLYNYTNQEARFSLEVPGCAIAKSSLSEEISDSSFSNKLVTEIPPQALTTVLILRRDEPRRE